MTSTRIFVTGGPASGKTTVARRLGPALDLPVFELDTMLLDADARGVPFEKAYNDVISNILATEAWVAEGAYLEWAEPLLRRAELILRMEVSWRKASYRIISRHIKASVTRTNRFPGWGRLYRFWRWSYRYYMNQNRPGFGPWGVADTEATAVDTLLATKTNPCPAEPGTMLRADWARSSAVAARNSNNHLRPVEKRPALTYSARAYSKVALRFQRSMA